MAKTRLTPDSKVVVAEGQISCDLDGEAAILNLKSGVYYGLDEVGARVWSLIQEPKAVREILEVLVAEYEVEAERCSDDLLALLASLADEGLLEVRDEASE